MNTTLILSSFLYCKSKNETTQNFPGQNGNFAVLALAPRTQIV